MLELLADPQIWLSFLTLAALEIVLGIDNLIFLSIISGRLPEDRQATARRIGLGLALGARLVMLFGLSWIIGLTAPIFSVFGHEVSWRDIILIGGGLFLIAKGTMEIHHEMEDDSGPAGSAASITFGSAVAQIVALDLVFSLDSVITAVGMSDQIWVMVSAVLVAMAVMLFAANPVGDFVQRHPTVKMLALSFLLLVGLALVADGFGAHIPKGYLYFAIAFSAGVEALNLMVRRRRSRPRGATAEAGHQRLG
ncbi:MAG TPA: TerC family protein [Alphaproteobacteria bacterium]|nr:TerC family protein [Alphaproteobacteria bacterium]